MNAPLGRDRLALLLSLVPYLRARRGPVGVVAAAERFGVAPEEIRAAVRLIAVSGAPGEVGTYQDLDLYDIDWDALEERDEIVVTRYIALEEAPPMSGLETASLIAGLQYLRQVPGLSRTAVVDALLAKLGAGAAGAPPIAVQGGSASQGELGSVRRAVRDGRRLEFTYRSPTSGERARVVDPIRLEALDDDWYLRAWCLDQEDERNFRVDRMRDVVVSETLATPHEAAALDDAFFTPADDDPVVELDVAASALPLIREFLDDRDRVPAPGRDGRIRVAVRAPHWDGIVRLAAGNAGAVRVVGPAEAREAVADWARRALDVQAPPRTTT